MRIFIIISLIINVGLLVSSLVFGVISFRILKKIVDYQTEIGINPEPELYPKAIKFMKITDALMSIGAIYGSFTFILAISYAWYVSYM